MNIHNLNKEELISLKESIEQKLKIDELNSSKKLIDLQDYEEIYLMNIHIGNLYKSEYVKIKFFEHEDGYWKFHTKPFSLSSYIDNCSMSNHCFLSEFCEQVFFLTLKPETWKEDLKCEIKRNKKLKYKRLKKELKKFENNIKNVIDNN
jgi:hypothetical protein